MAPRYRILLGTAPRTGPLNAAMLCCNMPALGPIGNRQAESLIGVAPFNGDSGKAQGARQIRGNRLQPQDGLSVAAMPAIRWNPDMAVLQKRPTVRGKKHEIALSAVMRKLIILADVLWYCGRE